MAGLIWLDNRCRDCMKRRLPGLQYCHYHNEVRKRWHKRQRLKMYDNRQCMRCGSTMPEGDPRVNCPTCREKVRVQDGKRRHGAEEPG